MAGMERRTLGCGVLVLVLAWAAGCGMTEAVRENTENIKITNQAIANNNAVMNTTTQGLQSLQASLADVSSLKKPMEDLAAQGPMFQKVAELREPMAQVAELRASLDQVAKLDKSMTDLARLEQPLQELGRLNQTVSVMARVDPTPLLGLIVPATTGFFLLLFLTIWLAVRLALHKSDKKQVTSDTQQVTGEK